MESMINPDYPLIDLHHHLDGSLRLETILELGLKHNLPLPAKTLEGSAPIRPGFDAATGSDEIHRKIRVDDRRPGGLCCLQARGL